MENKKEIFKKVVVVPTAIYMVIMMESKSLGSAAAKHDRKRKSKSDLGNCGQINGRL